jgi:hypothetical protein
VEVAQAMLDGALGIIEGSRRLNDLREALGIHHLDDDFAGFVAIDSETDALPIGDVRRLWNEEALVHKDREVEYRDGACEGCRKLIARFDRPSNPYQPSRRQVGRSSPSGRQSKKVRDRKK